MCWAASQRKSCAARELKRLHTATEAGHAGYPGLIERVKGQWRIKEKPPLIFPLSGQRDNTHEIVARTAFESYKLSLPEERRILLDRYELADVAFKVVGVGSVGTFCAIGLFVTRDDQTLLLQLKEAQTSALAPFAGPSLYRNQGQRVVVGQRIMQTVPDIFLGWTEDRGDDQHCYIRQLKDSRLALIGAGSGRGRFALSCDPVWRHAGPRPRPIWRLGSNGRIYRHRHGIR